MYTIEPYRTKLNSLCDKHKVVQLFLFGSAVKGQLGKHSDIDLLVDIDDSDPLSYSEHYFQLKEELQDLFKREVDLLESRSIKSSVNEEIEKRKVLIYG